MPRSYAYACVHASTVIPLISSRIHTQARAPALGIALWQKHTPRMPLVAPLERDCVKGIGRA